MPGASFMYKKLKFEPFVISIKFIPYCYYFNMSKRKFVPLSQPAVSTQAPTQTDQAYIPPYMRQKSRNDVPRTDDFRQKSRSDVPRTDDSHRTFQQRPYVPRDDNQRDFSKIPQKTFKKSGGMINTYYTMPAKMPQPNFVAKQSSHFDKFVWSLDELSFHFENIKQSENELKTKIGDFLKACFGDDLPSVDKMVEFFKLENPTLDQKSRSVAEMTKLKQEWVRVHNFKKTLAILALAESEHAAKLEEIDKLKKNLTENAKELIHPEQLLISKTGLGFPICRRYIDRSTWSYTDTGLPNEIHQGNDVVSLPSIDHFKNTLLRFTDICQEITSLTKETLTSRKRLMIRAIMDLLKIDIDLSETEKTSQLNRSKKIKKIKVNSDEEDDC